MTTTTNEVTVPPASALPAGAAVLVIEDGTRYTGRAYGATGRSLGEIVFSTGMTGYQETLTDPSYAGQIVLMTAPHIGNTGANDTDMESRKIWVEGFIVRDPARRVSNFRAERSLDEDLKNDGVVGISGIDTRAVTRKIRSAGAMRAGVFSGADLELSDDEQLALVRDQAGMAGKNLSAEVTTPERYEVASAEGVERVGSIAVLDLGIKRATVQYLSEHGFDVTVLPAQTTLEEIRELAPDSVFYSNGPGDPAASDAQVELLAQLLRDGLPYFGICFGNQLLGRALGLDTYKLPFGHRGINQPVLDKRTGRVEITAQNHGFAVDAPIDGEFESPAGFGRVQVSHYSLNDQVVEGLECLDIPAFSVQYHPEAAAGPHDAFYLFDRFRALVQDRAAAADTTTQGA
ncbi:Carbamoyl-phosphate synthase small chain [Leucobacter aridicollis]|uniref:Carbamoyl phosphate synthase small chain n=1 Tax=Leucobacter aridicollis TaxID=283878 RepID=A0A852R5S1_9MICO|nr:glutamine-hydrolyzing carbamoyl-phosphate synthase small subunit [Leucobacter aridicollis]MCS3428280.1 carbamoyl-phosphate synthase small subunit [Leucobacter aridicollis]NYD26845.1 carbamoyl-phosphate synthase small subunit [Leucobacter aridicollis]RKQ94436.1 carbamoyl-phosphate synthase small subunit [Mycolicibacterium mucogenicum 261Sha1.1M5]